MAVEGPALIWASTHIKHHATTDTDEDPHSPLEGFFHAHIGWMISDYEVQPEVYGKWLLKDRMVMFMTRTFFVWVALGFAIPYLLGGWTGRRAAYLALAGFVLVVVVRLALPATHFA